MKHINELFKSRENFSPRELTKNQIENNPRVRKKRNSRNIPQPVKRDIDGKLEEVCRFRLSIKFKDGNSRILPSIDRHYKLVNGHKFWYTCERTSYSMLVNLIQHKYNGKFITAEIYMNLNDHPLRYSKSFNYKLYKNTFDKVWEHDKVIKETGEILPLYNFKITEQKRFVKEGLVDTIVIDSYIDRMFFKKFYGIS